MTERPDFKIIIPPNTLKLKAERPGGITRDRAIAAGNAVVAAATGQYHTITIEEIDSLIGMVRDIQGTDRFGLNSRKSFYKRSHDMWAQGTTFDYPLVTEICGILCEYVEAVGDGGDYNESVLLLILASLKLIVGRRVTGPGTAVEAEMIDGLRKAVAKTLA